MYYKIARKTLPKVESLSHTLYFAAVGWEAHGLYGTMGIVLFVISIIGYVVSSEEAAS